jgi:hypothetical protein
MVRYCFEERFIQRSLKAVVLYLSVRGLIREPLSCLRVLTCQGCLANQTYVLSGTKSIPENKKHNPLYLGPQGSTPQTQRTVFFPLRFCFGLLRAVLGPHICTHHNIFINPGKTLFYWVGDNSLGEFLCTGLGDIISFKLF